jgi:hypothetical protein
MKRKIIILGLSVFCFSMCGCGSWDGLRTSAPYSSGLNVFNIQWNEATQQWE